MMNLIPTENWEYSLMDLVRGLRTAWSRRSPVRQSYIQMPGVGACLPIRSARAAIVLALRALALRPGASVAVPLYCCPVVLRAIKAAGCRARFIDVDPDTYCLSASDLAAKSSEFDAVIAVHMFGNVCNMPALREAAPGKPFIEDCAQAFGSRLNDRPAGSFSEIAVFSFRSGKYVSAGEGGAIHCRDADLESRLSDLIRALPVPKGIDEVVHVVNTYLRSLLRSKPLWGLVGSRLWSAYCEKVSYTSQSPIVLGQIYETDRDMTIRRLTVLASQIKRQRWNAAYYTQHLNVDAGMLCSEPPSAYFNRLQFPLLVPTPEQCDRLAARLLENKISTARPYKNIAAIAATHYGYTGDCPQAERIAKSVLMIPCNHAIGAADVEHIASCINHAWAEVRGCARDLCAPSIHSSATVAQYTQKVGSVTEPHHSS
jgi:perosamine synthetase